VSGTVISINLSPQGGVPKLPVPRATIKMEGIGGLQLVPSEQARHGPRKGCEPVLP
jgi:hypothetical protein